MTRTEELRLLKIPPTARRGEIITVKSMAEHAMEPGVRTDPATGMVYPRFIIKRVECRYLGEVVFHADWGTGVSANPFLSFKLRAERSGTIEITWIDDDEQRTRASAEIEVIDPPDSNRGDT